MLYLKLFLIAFPIFALLDLTWLGIVMSKFYSGHLSSIGRYENGQLAPNWLSALIAYIFLVLGLVLFVIPHAADKEIGWAEFIWGAVFGFIVYGVYEWTNHALVKGWPLSIVFVDVAWGTVLYGLTSFLTSYIARVIGII
jgi:uncharacterized membrane protein